MSIKVGLVYGAFSSYFTTHFPELKIINGPEEVKNFDLIIFSGGEDISPSLYGEDFKFTSPAYVNTSRDAIEVDVYKECVKLNKKMLGVCRGHQFLCAMLGGKLVQDLREETGKGHPGTHPIVLRGTGTLASMVFTSKEPSVNSMHHQGIKIVNVPAGLRCTASYNGIAEMLESDTILTTQFHPEFMSGMNGFFNLVKDWVVGKVKITKPEEHEVIEITTLSDLVNVLEKLLDDSISVEID